MTSFAIEVAVLASLTPFVHLVPHGRLFPFHLQVLPQLFAGVPASPEAGVRRVPGRAGPLDPSRRAGAQDPIVGGRLQRMWSAGRRCGLGQCSGGGGHIITTLNTVAVFLTCKPIPVSDAFSRCSGPPFPDERPHGRLLKIPGIH